jgi:hypothetical protein
MKGGSAIAALHSSALLPLNDATVNLQNYAKGTPWERGTSGFFLRSFAGADCL